MSTRGFLLPLAVVLPLAGCALTNWAQTSPDHKDLGLRTREYDRPAAEVSASVRDWVEKRERWKVAGIDGDRITRIEITTRVLRFVDDMTVTVIEPQPGRSRVDVYSRSRVGKSDLGVNARNTALLLAALDRAMKGEPRP